MSLVLPVYNESENLPELYDRLIKVMEKENLDFEIIFVDRGSDDETVQKLTELEASDHRIHVLGLAL